MKKPIEREKNAKVKIPIKDLSITKEVLRKPKWMKIKIPSDSQRVHETKLVMRKNNLHSVCEEASCPNLVECFNHGVATFLILGTICTRRCPFCDVAHGRPMPAKLSEPRKLAQAIKEMKLEYVVITSVARDDLHDGGAEHFSDCNLEIRMLNPSIKIEILVPDFRGCVNVALNLIKKNPPDIFNHNLETIPRFYKKTRPGASYKGSLELLQKFQKQNPNIPTKSGLMLGLGEKKEEIIKVLKDLRAHSVTMITLGQYLSPSPDHLPVQRYIPPSEFEELRKIAIDIGFTHAACGPFVRSSYHADLQAKGIQIR
ncbi:lipoyl synthase [Candidatus Photodesmus blepharus]|uniref:Lipoyl synthase n=1 Tax=Candidatus Photodesmus blepharonis TaxID=1179155 RepID=A0A084CPI7_9GAMM|nr:lipoyl synthase [Candidatus Photodesmus blepharus]KEY91716.1 lipoyl synthase [Candidatus Photodesmus blepharus]